MLRIYWSFTWGKRSVTEMSNILKECEVGQKVNENSYFMWRKTRKKNKHYKLNRWTFSLVRVSIKSIFKHYAGCSCCLFITTHRARVLVHLWLILNFTPAEYFCFWNKEQRFQFYLWEFIVLRCTCKSFHRYFLSLIFTYSLIYTNNMWLWYLYISSASRTDFWPPLLRALRRMASPEQRNGFWMRKHVCQQVNVLESRFVISGQFHPTHPTLGNGKKSAI